MKFLTSLAISLLSLYSFSQHSISGSFPLLANQYVRLTGVKGFDTYAIDSTRANEKGVFNLSFGDRDYGMGYLSAQDNTPLFVVLGDENTRMKGESFAIPESIDIIEGYENQLFAQYASQHPRREQALSVWGYLEKIYSKDSMFAVYETPKQSIANEKKRIKTEDSLFLAGLRENSYVRFYLPLRKLVSSVSTIAQYRTEEIPATIQAFRALDYTDTRLYKSGLLGDVIESHFWLIENSGRSLDSVYIEMNKSIDILIENLVADEQKLNQITAYLFKFLEKRSLFNSSEYLAIKLLNEKGCTINNDFAAQLESYRAMKKGNIAPDIEFKNDLIAPNYDVTKLPKNISGLESTYTAVVFGASWCPLCPQELSQMAALYQKWKKYNVEVVFISLDTEKEIFRNFIKPFPFISLCDYKKWESPAVKDYHVFATPTIYLLNNKREILLRPATAIQLDSWVDWYLVQGNK